MEKYSRGRRGAPAKGVGRETGARVQISPSPPQKSKHINACFFVLQKDLNSSDGGRRGLGVRTLPMADKVSTAREKTRRIATRQEQGDYVFEWAFQISPSER